MEYPGLQSPHSISRNLLSAPFSIPNVETARVPPSPTTQSDDFDSATEETIVCAPFPMLPVNFTQNGPTEQDWHRNTTPTTKSIPFDEVFQDGNAPVKQIIIQFPNSNGSWFILRCDEHEHDFMYPPLRGAAAHLRSKKHRWLRNLSNVVVVEHFGIKVLNCNAELAEKNNSVAFKAGQSGMKRSIACIADGMPGRQTLGLEKRPKFTTKGCSRTGVDRHGVLKRQSKQRRHEGIPSPIPGRIYLAYWEMTRDWLPALLLPHIGLQEFGVPSTLESLGLMDHIPECYEYDPETKDLKWKKGYEHGGPCVMEREFAVIYFGGNKFPDGSPADWVRAGDLQELSVFDASPRLVPNLKFARNFLRKRLEEQADTASESSTALSDVESDSETTSSSFVAGSGSPIISASDGMVPLMEELVTESISQEREVSLSPSMESETSRPDSQLENVNRNCCGNAHEPELGSVSDAEQTTGFDTRSQMADLEENYRTTIEDEADHETESSSCVARTRSPAMSVSIDLNQLVEESAAKPFSQEREASLSPSVQSEVLSQDPQLEQRDRSCHASAPEPELGSAPNAEQTISTDARSQMADSEVISISSSEIEMSDEGQPITASEPPSVQTANDTIQIDSGDSTKHNDKGTTRSNDPSTSPVHIHQHHIQRALSPEPALASTASSEQPGSFGTHSQLSEPGMISISSLEDELSDEDQPTTVNERQNIHSDDQIAQRDATSSSTSNSIACSQSMQPLTSPVRIHQRQIQRALSNHMAADLLKVKTKSIELKFPKAMHGFETSQPQLPPARPPTAQWHAGALIPPDNEPHSSTSSCNHIRMSVSQKPKDSMTDTEVPKTSLSGTFRTLKPKPPIIASDPTGRPQVAIPPGADDRTAYVSLSRVSQRTFRALTLKPPVTVPTSGSQSREPGIPPGQVPSTQPGAGAFVPVNTEANSSAPPIGQIQAPKLQTPQVPTAHVPSGNTNVVKSSNLGTLYLIREQSSVISPDKPPLKPPVRVPFPYSIQLQTGEPRFGQPPHEVPPYFLDRLRKLTGSQDENPLISAFLTKGLYLCPWCQKKYRRSVSFTDHLASTHSRSPDPKQGPIVSRAELDSGVDSDIIDLTSEP
ncbi:hypothetical protein B0T10DRAFT_499277 [Thelonectria olida]|uniref:C2H2-type domain-containing protein n=1 Tax=Thelonectria olida TaxID=1576542 RepID=A0A9P9AJ99_9HYPO|nr:hypothetical protein B0T10DRAFT_499277 [Thelonectria olida]